MPEPLVAESLREAGARVHHGFFTRQGGVSRGLYASLNCGFGSHDERAAVARNRALVAARLGAAAEALLTVHQVHGTDVAEVDAPWPRSAPPRADAMVSRTPGVALGVLTADCAPVLLADPVAGVIGAAHAGWRGALAGVVEATLAAMDRLGAGPGRVCAAVGPCIAQASYEVGAEVREHFLAADRASARFFTSSPRPDRFLFDLAGFVEQRLRAAGLAAVERLDVDTYAEPDRFFSYRRATHQGEPDYGRAVSAILLAA